MSARARAYHRLPQQTPIDAAPDAYAPEELHQMLHDSAFDDDDDLDNDSNDDEEDDEMLKKRQRHARSQQAALWSTKLHAFLWVLVAGTVCYAIDFFHVIFNDPRIRRGYFNVGLVCFGINTIITMYLAVWLPYIRKIHLEWSVYCPRMIPTATIVGVIATFCFIVAFWPIWGLLTPGLLGLFFIGSLMTAHFLPSI